MVISKCVPLAISRKKFSNFDIHHNPEEMIFVGFKDINGDKTNIRMCYDDIREDIKKYVVDIIKNDPEWGQGGSGGGTDEPEDKPSDIVTHINPRGVLTYNIAITSFDDDGIPVRGDTWDEENQTNFLNVQQKQALIEINAGGAYVEDFIYIYNPADGAITHVIVDNTGLPNPEAENGYDEPVEDFTLYYGGVDNNFEILTVPKNCRGVVQILHSIKMDMDFILHSSYTEVPEKYEQIKVKYIPDEKNESDEYNNEPIDKSVTDEDGDGKMYIDMSEEKGYVEFNTGDEYEYTFVFSQPELGSSTYMIINNRIIDGNYYGHPVNIRYGKVIDLTEDGIYNEGDLQAVYDITEVEDEICIIEIFHSLSADIVVKITKV